MNMVRMEVVSGLATPFESTGVSLPSEPVTAEQAMKLAGQDWDVLERPVYTHNAKGHRSVIEGYKATLRSDTEGILGIVKEGYKVTQNKMLYDFESALTDDAGLRYSLAGTFADGRLVWAQAELPKHIRIDGDDSEIVPLLTVWTGHDGSRGFGCGPTAVRIRCRNTFNMAVSGMKNKYVMRHTVSVDERIGEARAALKLSFTNLDAFEKVLTDLAKKPMTINEFKAFTEELLPANPDAKKPTKTLRDRETLVDLFSDKSSETMGDLRFTSYRALQAATEFVDHRRQYLNSKGNTASDNRALSILDGQGSRMKQRALDLLVG